MPLNPREVEQLLAELHSDCATGTFPETFRSGSVLIGSPSSGELPTDSRTSLVSIPSTLQELTLSYLRCGLYCMERT